VEAEQSRETPKKKKLEAYVCETFLPIITTQAPQHTATHCNTFHHTAKHAATRCNTLQHKHCNTLQHIATHCNALQRTATHCTALHRTAPHCTALKRTATHALQHPATYCSALPHTATHYNTLKHKHCNALQHIATQCVVLLCFIVLMVRKIRKEASSCSGISSRNFSKTLDFYYVTCNVLVSRLRWGWVFLELTRILSGIQFARYFMEFAIMETKRFVSSDVKVILIRQTCGQRSSRAAGSKRQRLEKHFYERICHMFLVSKCRGG